MATIKRFCDIKAWQEGRVLAAEVYAVTRTGGLANDYGFKDQLQRAVVSVNSNIAEGFERDSTPEFVKFLGYAKGSAGEVLSQLVTAHDIGYLTDEQFDNLSRRTTFISSLLAKFRTALLSSGQPGLRWKSPTPPSSASSPTQPPQPPDFETRTP